MPPRLKTLESIAVAAGSAFAYEESDFDRRPVSPWRASRVAVLVLAFASFAAAIAHQFGWSHLAAGLGIGRAAT